MKISDNDMKEFEKLFAPVLEWLDVEVYKKNPKPGFNMGEYYNKNINAKDFRGNDCEETFCVIGYLWKHHGFGGKCDYANIIIENLDSVSNFEDNEMVRNVLYRIVMVEDNNDNSLVYDLSKLKPYQVAAAIRYFLKTRKLKWKKFLDKDQVEAY